MLFSRRSETRNHPSPERAVALKPASQRRPAAQPPVGDEAASGSNATRTQSFIDASLTIVGDLHSEGDVRIEGRVCGNVHCAQLIVGKDAAITGAVSAEEAVIRGRITGKIRSPVVILQDTAHVESEITYSLIAIDDGAFFEGAAHRRDHPLEEEVVASPLLELQQVMLAAEGADRTGAESPVNGEGKDAVTAAAAAAAAAPAPLEASAAAAGTNGQASMANGHDPSG